MVEFVKYTSILGHITIAIPSSVYGLMVKNMIERIYRGNFLLRSLRWREKQSNGSINIFRVKTQI